MPRFSLKGATIAAGVGTDPTANPYVGPNPTTAIGQVVSGECTFGELTLIDVTAVGDTRKEFVPGTHAPLSASATILWDPGLAGHTLVEDHYVQQTLSAVRVSYPRAGGAASIVSNGYWTQVTAPLEVNGKLQATFSFMGSGPITFTA